MGMYTEVFVCTQLKTMPKETVALIQYMIGKGGLKRPTELPKHPLFTKPRWGSVLNCSSHYFVPHSVSRFEFDEIAKAWLLTVRADFKNYDGEASLLFDWLQPLVKDKGRTMIGYTRYEEDTYPTLYFADGSNIRIEGRLNDKDHNECNKPGSGQQ